MSTSAASCRELANQEFSAIIESTNGVPFVVERAMYWNALGVTWAAGTNAAGDEDALKTGDRRQRQRNRSRRSRRQERRQKTGVDRFTLGVPPSARNRTA